MQVDPEEFRRRFEHLSDDALLEIDRDELVEVAQELLDAELESRGLLEEEPVEEDGETPAAGEPNDPEDQMVLAAECGSMQEVQFARSLLKSAGIPTYVQTDFSGILGATEEDTRVYVPASFLEQAQEILATPLSDEELEAQAEAAGAEWDQETAESGPPGDQDAAEEAAEQEASEQEEPRGHDAP